MITFVVLAAGRGSRLGRVGDQLHKALVPLDGKAILTRQFELAPPGAKIVVVTGYRADQIERYVRLAHPKLDVTFVNEVVWGQGPGRSLLLARPEVEGDLVFTACDTLWSNVPDMWDRGRGNSWVGVSPTPAGTPAARWCRVVPDGIYVDRIDDKTPTVEPGSLCWTALARINTDDLDMFWSGLSDADTRSGEIQLSSGLDAILHGGNPIVTNHIDWLDVGDEDAYRAAQAQFGTYDPVKPGLATYVLPESNRVVKFTADTRRSYNRVLRAQRLTAALVPQPLNDGPDDTFRAFPYVRGLTCYDAMRYEDDVDVTSELLEWWHMYIWETRAHVERPTNWHELVMNFYRDKTFERVRELPTGLSSIALDAVTRVDWDEVTNGAIVGNFHGDLTYANVIRTDDGNLVGIDWREDFAGSVDAADLRYDLGKLLGSTFFHWQNASQGDFRLWSQGPIEAEKIRRFAIKIGVDTIELQLIAALTLINSAPLHASPMNEILVMRGAHLLGQLT